jgi:hypothetical protein
MGRSEWGVLVTNKADIACIQAVVAAHNAVASAAGLPEIKYPDGEVAYDTRPRYEAGEVLSVYALLRYDGGIWMCMGNGGGGLETSCYLKKHLPVHTRVLLPHAKPSGWYACKDYVWLASAVDEPVPIDSLSCFGAVHVSETPTVLASEQKKDAPSG